MPISAATEIPTHLVQKDATTLILSIGILELLNSFIFLLNLFTHYTANGEVLMIDLQASTPATRIIKRIKCFDGSVASLSLHPLENNLLLASSDIGY